jgi:hypothetical protein
MKRRHIDDDESTDNRRRVCTAAAADDPRESIHRESIAPHAYAADGHTTTSVDVTPSASSRSSSADAAAALMSTVVASSGSFVPSMSIASSSSYSTAAAAAVTAAASLIVASDSAEYAMTTREEMRIEAQNDDSADETTAGDDAQDDVPLTIARRRLFRATDSQFACHLDELATVEMQCVMQLLDHTSLLRFARCSHWLLSDADSDVAWKYQSPYHIEFRSRDLAVGNRLRDSLLRHAPAISVDWSSADGAHQVDATAAEVSAFLAIPRMTRLRVSRRLSADQSRRVLSHSALDALCELTLGGASELPFGFIDHLVRLKSLTNLQIDTDLPHHDLLTALPQLKLKTLKLNDRGDSREPRRTGAIAQCAHLTDLELDAPGFSGPRFRPFFTHLGPQLRRLTIRWFFARGLGDISVVIPAEDYIAVFRSLVQLRFLCLDSVLDVDDLLQHLHHAPVLQTLVVRPFSFDESKWPSVTVLQQLIRRTPSALHVDVEVRPFQSSESQRYTALDPARCTCRVVNS